MKFLLLMAPALLAAQILPFPGSVRALSVAAPVYTYSRPLTIDRTKCGASNLTNFPVLVSITDATLKIVGSGGHIQHTATQSSGPAVTMPADFIFTSDALGATRIPWEVASWDSVNGILLAWVLLPTVNGSGAGSNTPLYIFYGDPATTTPQNTGSFSPASVWPAYSAAWHMEDNAATTVVAESAGTLGSAGTNGVNTSGKSVAGKFGKALTFNGSSDFANAPLNLSGTSITTVSFWLNWTTYASDDHIAMEFTPNINTTTGSFLIDPNFSAAAEVMFGMGKFSGAGSTWIDGITRPSAGAWHHYIFVMDRATPVNKAYVDGALVSETSRGHLATALGPYANSTLNFMARSGGSIWGAGSMQEVRVASAELTSSWALSEFNNENAPGNIGANNFLIYGSEVVN